jgi:GT2 family glycosyltransferase
MPAKYDLAIAYRIYPKVSKVPPVFADDKFKLSELCLKSFKDSLGELNVKIWVILDNCPAEYKNLFLKYFNADSLEFIDLPGVGNPGSFGKQVEVLMFQDDSDYIYFAEDDYFYLPNLFHEMLNYLKSNRDVHFITPYDHPDYYENFLHKYKSEIRPFGFRHWRTGATTTMTFLTSKEILNITKKTFITYKAKNYDTSLWLGLTKYRLLNPLNFFKYLFFDRSMLKIFVKGWLFGWAQLLFGRKWKLWVPIPTIATHMDDKHLAPSIDWFSLFN